MAATRIQARARRLRARAEAAYQSPGGRRAAVWVRRGVTLVIIAAIVWQLADVGWDAVVSELPTQPLFYVLLLFVYFSLPLFEVLIYVPLWGTSPRETLLAAARKRVFNEDLIGYSGEVYFYTWATRRGISRGEAFRTVRDVNIVSSLTSLLFAIGLLVVIVALGQFGVRDWFTTRAWGYWAGGALALAAGVALAIALRRYIFALPLHKALGVMAVHGTRLIVAHAAMIWMWSVAVPNVPLATWIAFATVLVVINRLPLLPSKDLLFVGAGVELAKTLEIAAASVAGVFLVQTVSTRVFNLIMLLVLRPEPVTARPERTAHGPETPNA